MYLQDEADKLLLTRDDTAIVGRPTNIVVCLWFGVEDIHKITVKGKYLFNFPVHARISLYHNLSTTGKCKSSKGHCIFVLSFLLLLIELLLLMSGQLGQKLN